MCLFLSNCHGPNGQDFVYYFQLVVIPLELLMPVIHLVIVSPPQVADSGRHPDLEDYGYVPEEVHEIFDLDMYDEELL